MIDISKITISFSNINKELQNLPFCFCINSYLNEEKNRVEKFVLFTTQFQLRKFKDCLQIFMDGTFYASPKKYYQLYNIIGKEKKSGINIPLAFVLMTHKSYSVYFHLFNNIKNFLEKNNINLCFKNIYIMMDFEKASRNELKMFFLIYT